MTFTSVPKNPLPPESEFYPLSALFTCQIWNRATYLAAAGVQAPAFNPALPIKTWVDTSADPTKEYEYYIGPIAQLPELTKFTIAGSLAATLNLPGSVAYSPYVIRPTSAVRSTQFGLTSINPRYLSLESEALALLLELTKAAEDLNTAAAEAGKPVVEYSFSDKLFDAGAEGFFTIDYGDDPRRWWYFLFQGRPIYVGLVLEQRNELHGVGYPGHWDLSEATQSGPYFVFDPPAATGLNGPQNPIILAQPVRPLIPGIEVLTLENFGVVGVHRLDLQP